MASHPYPTRLSLPIAAAGAALAGLVAAATLMLMPMHLLEALVVRSGAPSLVNAAQPPLGLTARAVLAIAFGSGAAAVGWAALFLLFDTRRLHLRLPARTSKPRRADAHPDAPPRRPIFAESDLGTPFLEVGAAREEAEPPEERPLPADFGAPLAAFDPGAIREKPLAPASLVEPLAPRPAPLDPGERIETVSLAPALGGKGANSVESLLDRLERSARERRSRPVSRPGSVEDTLSTLRALAVSR